MDKIKISSNISFTYQISRQSSLYLATLYSSKSGQYLFSVMSNSQDSLIKQISSFIKLDEYETSQLRKHLI